jgi:hypothetical protein
MHQHEIFVINELILMILKRLKLLVEVLLVQLTLYDEKQLDKFML